VKNECKKIRNVFHVNEFEEFYNSLDNKSSIKLDEAILYLETIYVLSTKFVKKIQDTDENLYELRVSVGFNEYRTIIFAIDHDNVIQAKYVLLLNGFLKKNSKDYKKQIKIAENILNKLEYETEIRP
jgi:hypothetical protein